MYTHTHTYISIYIYMYVHTDTQFSSFQDQQERYFTKVKELEKALQAAVQL